MKAKGCLIALGVALAVLFGVAALLGPTLLREGRRVYVPISKMRTAQDEFDEWVRETSWKDPETPTLTPAQLDRFLALRRELSTMSGGVEQMNEGFGGDQKPRLQDVPRILEGVGGVVAGQIEAYRKSGMTPGEYRYIDRLAYRTWLRALKAKGADPASVDAAAAEIDKAAAAERDRALAARLRSVAAELRARTPNAPEGIPEEIHALLVAKAKEIEALSDVRVLPVRRRR